MVPVIAWLTPQSIISNMAHFSTSNPANNQINSDSLVAAILRVIPASSFRLSRLPSGWLAGYYGRWIAKSFVLLSVRLGMLINFDCKNMPSPIPKFHGGNR